MQNVLSHWMPRFIIDCYIDLVLGDNKKAHTITYKGPENILAPTLVNYLESRYKMKPKQRDCHGQTKIGEFKHMIEIERMGKVTRDYCRFHCRITIKNIKINSNITLNWPYNPLRT